MQGQLQLLVRSVAEWRVRRMLALAQRYSLGLIEFEFHGRELRPLMRSIAERLILRCPAPAPVIRPCLQVEHRWFLVGNFRFVHGDGSFGRTGKCYTRCQLPSERELCILKLRLDARCNGDYSLVMF